MAKGKGQTRSGGGGKGGGGDEQPHIENRKARFDYHILDTLETGMVLKGSEIKSVRDGKVSLGEGYVRVEYAPAGLVGQRAGKKKRGAGVDANAGRAAKRAAAMAAARYEGPSLWLHSVNIGEYAPAGPAGAVGQHAPTRVRKLLAHKREIAKLAKEVQVKGMTIVPLKIYFKNGKAKLLIGLGKGKTQGDKRETIAKRETDREMARAMSKRY